MKYHNGKDGFIMREHVGEVDENKYDVKSISTTLNRSPIVEFEDGSMVTFDWQWIMNKAIECKQKEGEENV